MTDRYITITIETRAGQRDITGETVTAIYDLDLEEDGSYIDQQFHEDIHDHLLNLLEQYQGDNE